MGAVNRTGKLILGRSGNSDIRSHAIEVNNNSGGANNFMKFLVHDGGSSSPYETRTEVMTLLGNGNVGIGTVSPEQKLHIEDSANPGILIENTDGTLSLNQDIGSVIFKQNDNSSTGTGIIGKIRMSSVPSNDGGNFYGEAANMIFSVGKFADDNANIDAVTIKNDGNVGIGTTSPATYLHLSAKNSDPGSTEGDLVGTHTLTEYLRFTSRGDGGDVNGVTVGFKLGGDDNSSVNPDGRLDICANDGASAGNEYGLTPDRTIATFLGSGNVGIGTSSPLARLDVQGTGAAPLTSHGTTTAIMRTRATNTNVVLDQGALPSSPWSYWMQVSDSTNLGLEYPLALNPNGGNVGIGTTSPKTLTHIGKLSANSGTHTTIPSSNMGVSASFPDSTHLWLGNHSSAQAEDYWGMAMGTVYAGSSYIQTLDKSNSSYYNLLLQPNGGNVGIGTASPGRPLEIAADGGGAILNLKRTNAGTGQGALAFVNLNSNVCAAVSATRTGAEGGNLVFYTIPDDTTLTSSNPYLISERMRITSGGNVGIGTNNPDYNLEVNGSVGVSGKQMYPMLRWEIDLTSQSNSNFYPIEFTHPVSEGTPDLPDLHPIHFKVFGESLGGGNPYNENTLVGYAKGGGWSDHGPMYDVHIRRFSPTEHRFQGIYEGQSIAMEQIVIYMRGGYRYSAITDATSVVTHTSAYTIPHNTSPTTFAIKNSSGTDVSGTSAQISQLVNLAANARRSERFMSGDLHVDGYIKNSTTPSWNLYMQGSPTPTTSGTLEFNNTKASGINCTLNTSGGLTSRVTITVAGRYFIGFQAFTENDVSAGSGVNHTVRINGSEYVRSYHAQPITNYSAMGGLGCVADLSVNDYVDIYSSHDIHYNANGSFYGFMIA